ncbi:MAG TPA: T9SS type A sorting domain-containing protein [Saprospiraceae bacterium]|nr:T9SS type A sorting domain-containing protein [Saprospiraceae bacterium]
MKPLLYLTITLALTLPAYAQSSWFPGGAKWYYQYGSMLGQGMTTLEVMDEDTVIGTWTYRKLLSTTISEFLGSPDTITETMYIREDNQVVYGHDHFMNGVFLYDFNAAPGDTLPMSFGGLSPEPFVVDSIGDIEINGHMLAFQDIRFPNLYAPGEYYEMRVMERIGSNNSHLFHHRTVIQPFDAPSYHLRCYEDDELGLIRLTDDSGPCDLLEGTTATSESTGANISIFPNPAYDVVYVQSTHQDLDQLAIVDMLGSIRIKSKVIYQSSSQIDVSDLGSGLYYILGFSSNGEILFTKLITKSNY